MLNLSKKPWSAVFLFLKNVFWNNRKTPYWKETPMSAAAKKSTWTLKYYHLLTKLQSWSNALRHNAVMLSSKQRKRICHLTEHISTALQSSNGVFLHHSFWSLALDLWGETWCSCLIMRLMPDRCDALVFQWKCRTLHLWNQWSIGNFYAPRSSRSVEYWETEQTALTKLHKLGAFVLQLLSTKRHDLTLFSINNMHLASHTRFLISSLL